MNTIKLRFLSFFILILGVTSCSSQKELIKEGQELQLISNEFEFTEGPASEAEGNIYFTDQPNNRIYKWSAEEGTISVFMENSGRANGLYFDSEGNLLAAADENSEIWKINSEKEVEVLVDSYQGKRLNGPNDLWIAPGGGFYFTDPYYQRDYWERTEKEIEEERVYYVNPQGEISIVVDDLVQPNGIIGTPDGKTLYIADIGANKTYSYRINRDGSLSDKKLFTELGSDGMTIDNRGNVYLTGNGVTVFDKSGNKIQHIPIDKDWTANVTFGGKNQQTLFITAQQALYSLEMNVKGVRW
ncbi:SMP-30/gluconolactonase/LRE family protein [Salegentibacter sp. BDJ18]|uniref:SMP-30/gluconolactonase/LRE family protein n=1 Tax=Salegentibacter sp. BDJ18 TaxID=2816376 RepID=UPI001AAF6629|nr:SMP-30/gluconolactonase/LRE family protein [Salegentibacter sp. BDJ18]MBO2544121.1 SMP-30/gluconolactonase/LRE family protein [Salegentibacter sp. BDJ18]